MTVSDLKIDILKQEIQIVVQRVHHFDDLRHRTKQMAITLWLTALGVGITSKSRALVGLAAFVPFPFWYFDATYHRYQEGYTIRWLAIRNFLRTGEYCSPEGKIVLLKESLNTEDFGAFPIPDYYGNNTIEKTEHKGKTSLSRNFFKMKMILFYGSLFIIAIVGVFLFNQLRLGN